MKSAVAFQAHTAQSGNIFKPAYWPDVVNEAGWNRGLGSEELNKVAIGCRLTMEFVLMEIPEAPAGNKVAEAKSPLCGDCRLLKPPAEEDPSGRSAITTLIKSRRHRLVAKPPMTPGLA